MTREELDRLAEFMAYESRQVGVTAKRDCAAIEALLRAYPLPVEGERDVLAGFLELVAETADDRRDGAFCFSAEECRYLDRAAALLVRPVRGVSVEAVLALIERYARRHPNWEDLHAAVRLLPEAE